jgi:hypothetical protein
VGSGFIPVAVRGCWNLDVLVLAPSGFGLET